MLDPRLFKIGRFGIGSLTITMAFLVMFGFFFVLTQYLQFVLDYTPLQAAVRTLPFALAMVLTAPRGPALAARIGGGRTMALGMLVATVGLVLLSPRNVDTGYPQIAAAIMLAAGGMALVFPTATEAIVSSLPQSKAGVASAMNDTTREVGGAIGIALLGTLLSSGYRSGLGSATDGLPPELAELAEDNVGAALAIADQVPAGGEAIAAAAREAFVDGMQLSLGVAAAVMLAGAVVVALFFPRSSEDLDEVPEAVSSTS